MEKKLTQRDYFNALIAHVQNDPSGMIDTIPADEVIKFLQSRIDQLDKKSANKKPTKIQEANEELKQTILQIMNELDKPVTVAEILSDERIERGTSGQKITSMIKQLKDAGLVIRTEEKGTALFSVA